MMLPIQNILPYLPEPRYDIGTLPEKKFVDEDND